MPTCFFIGHREAPDSLLPQLSAAVERHIMELGVTEFVVGSYGWFDSMAARTVRATKKHYPEVTLTLLFQRQTASMAHFIRQGWKLYLNGPLLSEQIATWWSTATT